jgi:hypothetical protein
MDCGSCAYEDPIERGLPRVRSRIRAVPGERGCGAWEDMTCPLAQVCRRSTRDLLLPKQACLVSEGSQLPSASSRTLDLVLEAWVESCPKPEAWEEAD